MRIFAKNFRGFKQIEVDLDRITFLVGDNSSGKSSILHLVDSVISSELSTVPRMDEEFGVSQFDYFSPYFEYADVTFGYSTSDEGATSLGKILTVRSGKDGDPFALSSSYFSDSTLVSFRKVGGEFLKRTRDFKKTASNFDLIDLHNEESGFEPIKLKSEVQVNDVMVLFLSGSMNDEGFRDKIMKVVTESIPPTRMVSPIRALPEKFYSYSRKISAHGSHFASAWLDFEKSKSRSLFHDAKQFGKESALFDSLKVERVAKQIQNSPLVVRIDKSGKQFFLNQLGVGVSQVVPVLVETILALAMKPNLSVLIQQPELHLHPVAQSALGTYLFRMAKKKLRGVFETHSSFLLDRFRSEIRISNEGADKLDEADEIAIILFCENSETGNRITEIRMAKNGSLMGEPETYHKFFVDEMLRTMF